ncbi:MAG: S8 family peptidase [Gracilimonas sp.]|uniref:S8 family peptidase n=1 Tax=Gracilimonas sp. TaxID=1974203 RepID=UPI001B244DD1|nr:S8 family peptidase [Gracilimonas sp.]MBO6585326.1 S8 family peptidase [Gracilimonas sp.]MBO6616322.1 S8 family peptidase [Gracilimonas sp.]
MADEQYPHLKFDRFFKSGNFENPRGGGSKFEVVQRIRRSHGASVKRQFSSAVNEFENRAKEENEDLFNEDIIYLEFESEPGYHFKTDSFDNGHGYYKLSYSRVEKRLIEGEVKEVQKIGIYINKKGVSKFLDKIEQFLDPEKDTKKGNPRNQPLLANIASIRAATLECFWTEPTDAFSEEGENEWWEIWLRRDEINSDEKEDEHVRELLQEVGADVGNRRILFPEHIIILAKGTPDQLSRSLLYSDKLSELRKPKETSEFFLREELEDSDDWLENLQNRIEDHTIEESVFVCVLDSGVNRGHPLLSPFLSDRDMHKIKPDWDDADSYRRGHGTQMAGNVLYGDLTEHLTGDEQIQLFHKLESVKIINPDDPNDEKLYGAITIEAANQPVVLNPDNNRVYCMAVSSSDHDHEGEPSSWSSAVDQIVYGDVEEPNEKSLFLVSAGNAWLDNYRDYPAKNEQTLVNDPSQAFNALTIAAYTEKGQINPEKYPDSFPLATRGSLSPFSTTGVQLDKKWANKPDVVFEGGNLGIGPQGLIEPDSLKLLSVGADFQRHPFSDNHATSAATALASKFAAELYSEYRDYWPETIRGLIIHSAEWNDVMKRGNGLNNVAEKRKLIRTYGYGVPDLARARYSASDRLTLISERTIQPYIREGSNDPKINQYHLYELPWPVEALNSLFDEEIRVNVTLSYFIEPNPGKKEYSQSYSYQSVGLRFKMCRPNETDEEFAARVNKLARDDDYESDGSEDWKLGPDVRDKGSIHRDWLMTTGPELATKNKIAVFPVGGWWKTRKKLERYGESVRYSLIVSIDAPNQDIGVDLYTPVQNLISVDIET